MLAVRDRILRDLDDGNAEERLRMVEIDVTGKFPDAVFSLSSGFYLFLIFLWRLLPRYNPLQL